MAGNAAEAQQQQQESNDDEHPEQNQTAPQHDNDLFLRPPLLRPPTSSHPDHDKLVRPMICRMWIASNTLRVDVETRFTAIVLWHRYCSAILSSSSSVTNNNNNNNNDNSSGDDEDDDEARKRKIVLDINDDSAAWAAAACLFLACKAEEEPRRLRDIINVAHMFLKDQPQQHKVQNKEGSEENGSSSPAGAATISQQQSAGDIKASGNGKDDENQQPSDHKHSPLIAIRVRRHPPRLDEQYWTTKEKIVRSEQVVLRWIGFDTTVSKPHRAVPILLLDDQPSSMTDALQKWELTADQIVPLAWRRLNNALFYSPALQHSVLELACASIGLAVGELLTARSTTNGAGVGSWWRIFDISDVAFAATTQALLQATECLQPSLRKPQNSGTAPGHKAG